MNRTFRVGAWGASVMLLAGLALPGGAQTMECQHHADVAARGDHVMGFDHEKTTHHFRLTKSGGTIEVGANDPSDSVSRDAIRGHLAHVAGMFAKGNFEAPVLVHGRTPPGAETMRKRKAAIDWKYEETSSGGRIVASTRDAAALSAIHKFLRFQIEDHATGDSIEIRDKEDPGT